MAEELAVKEEATLAATNVPLGFEDEEPEDMIIPRVKIVQTLSPERKEKIAEEGDIINSLTKEKLNGKKFIPVFKFNNHIWWKDRADGGGILCMSRDGKRGEMSDGTLALCSACRKCEFDNTKQGKEAVPTCVKYINFFGFFEGEHMPIILSFSKTSYNEGKKLYSLAKVTMQNMWNYGYTINEKLMAKGNNEWYVPVMSPAGPTSDEDREFGMALYKTYRNQMESVAYDMEDSASSSSSTTATVIDPDSTEY